MSAVKQMQQQMSLAKSLKYAGVSKCAWYYNPETREVRLDQDMVDAVSSISDKRPTYETRRMAAQISRETDIPVNRKQIQRIYRKTGYIDPQKTKNDIIVRNARSSSLMLRTGCSILTSRTPGAVWTAGATALT